jgi:NADPH-dependent 2,4-dienoyl-CoA reductase/sulfur reductase-like enzyme
MSAMKYDVAVIGGGPAGLAAALEAKAAAPELSVVILERDRALGGILRQCIHNGFGLHFFKEELTGPEYADRFIERLKDSGVEWLTDTMVLELTGDRRMLVAGPQTGLAEIEAGAVVLAMGCRERTRGALNIPGTRPAGVYTAGCVQRLVNIEGYLPGRRVVILGSGDIGLIMARRLTWEGAKVEVVAEVMPYSSGLNRNIVQCLEDNDTPLLFNHTVTAIHGNERVEGVTIAQVDPATRRPLPGTQRHYDCDTLLLSVGLIPENELTKSAGIPLNRITGGPEVGEDRQTCIPGIFACGNVLHVHDLVDNVSDEAIITGRAAALYARGGVASPAGQRATRAGKGVRYVVPQRVASDLQGEMELYFRVGAVYRPATLIVKCDGEVLARRKRPIMAPGEMEKVVVALRGGEGDITLEIEEA